MQAQDPPLLRAALAIYRKLGRTRSGYDVAELPLSAFERCRRLEAHARFAQARGWPFAHRAARARLAATLVDLRRQLDVVCEDVTARRDCMTLSLRDIFDDLKALDHEFERVRVDLKERHIAAATPPVEIEGVYLGRFEIILDWERLAGASGCYEVAALDPNPAATDSSVIHPHVRDGQLCEGEAWSAIRAALGSGRVLDFFTLVARTLASYNPDSAYVGLDRWSGASCADCGCTSSDDDGTSCEGCGCDLCGDCGSSCTDCGRNNCSDCSYSCRDCRQSACENCLASCNHCNQDFCERCLSDGQCSKCRQAAAQEGAGRKIEADSPATPTSSAPLDALCVGEAAHPA